MKEVSTSAPWLWISDMFRSHIRQPNERKIGIEIERIGIWDDYTPFLYRAGKSPSGKPRPGAEALLNELYRKHQWPLIKNAEGRPLGLTSNVGKVSLEPGSQVELSTDPYVDLVTTKNHIDAFENQVSEITTPWGLHWIGLGVNPKHAVADIDLIPSTRYHIMDDYLGKRATLGTSMMRRTSSVQINLDYTSEVEAIEMLRAALLAAPVSYALFGNSPFVDGKDSGFQSYRGKIWQETDPDRTGMMPEAFTEGFSFEDYAKYAWHRPLMFVQDKKTNYVAANGNSIADIANGKLPNIPVSDANRLNSIRELFIEARLKPGYVEVRSIDGLLPEDRYAASAFWLGLLYSPAARKQVLSLLGNTTPESRDALFNEVLKTGLRARLGDLSILNIAHSLVELAESELKSRGYGEEKLLSPAKAYLVSRQNPGARLVKRFHDEWNQDIHKVIDACRQIP